MTGSSFYTETFRIRYAECNAFQLVARANYLRFMQETTFNASAAAGYRFERYLEIGHYWFVREIHLEHFSELRYGDTIEVKTWVSDFRRVRSKRMYEFRRTGSSELVAQASADWVYVNIATRRPTIIPDDLIAAFAPDGLPASPVRQPLQMPAPPQAGVYTTAIKVKWSDLDGERVVSNAVVMNYLEDTIMEIGVVSDRPLSRLYAEGFAIVPTETQIEYLSPASVGDELEVSTWLDEAQSDAATRYFRIVRSADAELVAQARMVLANRKSEYAK